MRILIDLQGAQATHHGRGIGRYALSLALALIRQSGSHEIRLLLNGHYPQAMDEIRHAVGMQLPAEHVHVWQGFESLPSDTVHPSFSGDFARRLRSAVMASIRPDVVLITSLFEGPGHADVVAIEPNDPPTAVVLYDLIPLIHADVYLTDPAVQAWYQGRLHELQKAQLLLAISGHSRTEAIEHLQWPADRVVNISTACEEVFSKADVPASMWQQWSERHRLHRPFLMYTGGIDHRKNIERLIRAYGMLPQQTRSAHQLLIVCAIGQTDRERLQNEAALAGLNNDELVITGYVSEQELVALYNACKAFVFPSWHEGFGLPVLEAMRCGKAVIASRTTSLPEVVGLPEALFDPFDESDICRRMHWVLSDEDARARLEQHALLQSRKFDWDTTARTAIQALEACIPASIPITHPGRPHLACVSPLPPAQSGISDYTVQLLKALSAHYRIDVIVEQEQVSDPWILQHCSVRTAEEFEQCHRHYDRVLYHFGNSHFHDHMPRLLQRIPGVVVLHDFYLSGLQSYHLRDSDSAVWQRMLYDHHGYPALLANRLSADRNRVIWHYPCNLAFLQQATGIIVHSQFSLDLACQWYGAQADEGWRLIPLLREPPEADFPQRNEARAALNLPANALVVCTFGLIGEHKLNIDLLDAFLSSSLARRPDCMLVFVGQNDGGSYGNLLMQRIEQSGLGDRIRITGWTPTSDYRQYLVAADIAVQLRSRSRGETSAAVLDCMSHGLPTIVNANGSMADLHPDTVWMLPDAFFTHELCLALEILSRQPDRRQRIGHAARNWLSTHHAPSTCALQYRDAIEHFHRQAQKGLPGLTEALRLQDLPAADRKIAATTLAHNFPPRPRPRQLLVDISELVRHDARTGIQRVTRAVLNEWLRLELSGWRIEPVFASKEKAGYCYARRYTSQFLGLPQEWAEDCPVQADPGDIFLGLDLQPQIIPAQRETLRQWRRSGVKVQFVVYDLLPVQCPQFFVANAAQVFTPWLNTVAEFDAALCISRATRDTLQDWLCKQAILPRPALKWFHLGADVEQSMPTYGLTGPLDPLLENLRKTTGFLMVGTLEPRKGHAQVLDAFEQLWQDGHDLQLIIVGKQGWQVDELVQRLQAHPENGHRLHWLQGASDEALNLLYSHCAALIAASYAEGYGLPLIEAARHGCPILARDIPVFREVAETHAFYFVAQTAVQLANAIEQWLALRRQGRHPTPRGMHILTWRQSAHQLLQLVGVESPPCPE